MPSASLLGLDRRDLGNKALLGSHPVLSRQRAARRARLTRPEVPEACSPCNRRGTALAVPEEDSDGPSPPPGGSKSPPAGRPCRGCPRCPEHRSQFLSTLRRDLADSVAKLTFSLRGDPYHSPTTVVSGCPFSKIPNVTALKGASGLGLKA